MAMALTGLLLVPVAEATSRHSALLAKSGFGKRTLKRGMSGKDVQALQGYLTDAGHDTDVDGQFGPDTEDGVERFERESGREVDGEVDRRDAKALTSQAAGGGALFEEPTPPAQNPATGQTVPGEKATLTADGLAIPPASAPEPVKKIIERGNVIAKKPYVYGGGHRSFSANDRGYDCSGSVSFALGRDFLKAPMPSGSFTSWGESGPGQWVTIYAHGGHMYAVIAGLRFDTSGRQESGSRWHDDMRSERGYTVRHPEGL
jgi:peptidoglycan hydrolase-like protein with peptidoglycan-binding domain